MTYTKLTDILNTGGIMNLIEPIEFKENRTVFIGPKMASIILYLARKEGIRGSSSKKKRIRKKVLGRMFNIIMREYMEKLCTKKNSE